MNCQQVQLELSAYIDGELPAETWLAVEKHIERCASCRKRVAELRKLAEGVASLHTLAPPTEFLAAVRRKVAAGETRRRQTWVDMLTGSWGWRVPLGAVAAAAILVGAVMLTRPPGNESARRMLAMGGKQPEAGENMQSPSVLSAPSAPAAGLSVDKDERDRAKAAVRQAPAEEASPADQARLLDAESANAPASAAEKQSFGLNGDDFSAAQYGASPRMEEVTVESRDSSFVLARVGFLANNYSGRVEAPQQEGAAVQVVYVQLPTVNAAAFKTHLNREFPASARLFGSAPAAAPFSRFDGGTSFPMRVTMGDSGTAVGGAREEAGNENKVAVSLSTVVVDQVSGSSAPASVASATGGGTAGLPVGAAGSGPVPQAERAGLMEPETALPAALPSTTVLRIQIVSPDR